MKQLTILLTLLLTTFTLLTAEIPVATDANASTPAVKSMSEKQTKCMAYKAEKCADKNCTIEKCDGTKFDGTKCKSENNCTALKSRTDGNATVKKCKSKSNCTSVKSGTDGNVTAKKCGTEKSTTTPKCAAGKCGAGKCGAGKCGGK